jgi:pyridoxine 4-dehydrogenase
MDEAEAAPLLLSTIGVMMPLKLLINAQAAGQFRLGKHYVSRMGYGAMQLRKNAGNIAEAIKLIRRAVDLGVNHFDTAEFYGTGFVNDALGQALRNNPDVVIATKVGADPNPGGATPIKLAQRPEQLRASIEANLKSLKVEQISIAYLRRTDVAPSPVPDSDQVVDINDQMAVMVALRDEGKIGAIGLSSIDLTNLKHALPAGIACVQNAYNLLSRRYEDLLNVCFNENIAWVPFFPMGGAHSPEWPKVAEHATVANIAAAMNILPSQVGLAWLLAHRANTLLIPGTANIQHLDANVASASVILNQEQLAQLDAIGAPLTFETR